MLDCAGVAVRVELTSAGNFYKRLHERTGMDTVDSVSRKRSPLQLIWGQNEK